MAYTGRWRRRLWRTLVGNAFLLGALALLNRVPHPGNPAPHVCSEQRVRIWVIADGWHSGLVLPTQHPYWHWWQHVPTYQGYPYIEFGWGEEDYYPNPRFETLEALEALFWANGAVLHVTHYTQPPTDGRPLDLCPDAYLALCTSILADRSDTTALAAPGLYGRESRFYQARGTYWCLGNCHGWTARQLRTAGIRTPWLNTTGSAVRFYLPPPSSAAGP